MEFKQIQELIKLANKYDIADLEIAEGDFRIRLRTVQGVASRGTKAVATPVAAPAPAAPAPTPAAPAAPAPAASDSTESPDAPTGNQITIQSPIIGTFYRSPGPDKGPFVKVGDKVAVGDTLCIIEAMKLFNEIESEVSGTIVKVLVEDASPVEYDQPLFIVEPA